jgi:hypothetical protein
VSKRKAVEAQKEANELRKAAVKAEKAWMEAAARLLHAE